MSTVTLSYPRYYTAATVAYEPEATAPSDTTALTDLVMLNAKKIMALVKASSEISEDAPLFADFIASALGYALETAVDKAFFQGDGSSTYYGIQGISSATVFPTSATGWVAAASGHSALSSIDNTDIATLISTLPSAFHDDAVFVMHPAVWGQLCVRLSATAGEPLGDTVPTRWFNGYRVVLAPQMPSGTTSLGGKTVMAFGNFKRGSMLGMRRDTQIRYSPSRYLDTDQIGISGTTRFDVVHHGLGDSSNAGAIVALKATT
jgi:HK97 family phage major capsid protein